MRPVAKRNTLLDQLIPPALRSNPLAQTRRARLLGVTLAFGPGMGITMCILLILIDLSNAQHVWPLIVADLFFWALLGLYWFRAQFLITAHLTMLVLNTLIIYFAFLWGVGSPTTVWMIASTIFAMYLLDTKRATVHVTYLFAGFGIAAFGEFFGLFSPAILRAETEALMSLASALVAIFFTMMVTAEVRFLYARTEKLLDGEARTDVLTGIANRRHFFDVAEKEAAAAAKDSASIAVLLIDMDHFKNINDTWGHAAGDKALKAVADVLNRTVPKFIGMGARVAGDEFAAIISRSELKQTAELAENIRHKISQCRVYSDRGQLIKLSVSIGVTEFFPVQGETIDDGLARADRLLYKAKDSGRNTVIKDDRLRVVAA